MKTVILILLAAICAGSACSSLGLGKAKPTPEAMSAALTKFITQDNQYAKIEGMSINKDSMDTYISVKFGCKNFSYKDKNGEKKSVYSGTGNAGFKINDSGKWILEDVGIVESGETDSRNFSPKIELN